MILDSLDQLRVLKELISQEKNLKDLQPPMNHKVFPVELIKNHPNYLNRLKRLMLKILKEN